jgi:hypothetical protein
VAAKPGTGGRSTPGVVQALLQDAGLDVAQAELDQLVTARDAMLERVALLRIPEAESYEPADVFSAVEPSAATDAGRSR